MSRLIASCSSLSRGSGDYGWRLGFVEGAVAEHDEEAVGPTPGEAERGLGHAPPGTGIPAAAEAVEG
jgi:hypothetical protein